MAGSMSTATAIALAGTALSTGMGVYGALSSANAQQQQAKYQSEVDANNAATATQNANYTSASGEQQAAIKEQQTRAKMGAIEAGQGSSGVDINSASSKAGRTSTQEIGALDAQTIRSNAARQAYGYETQSTNFINQQKLENQTANNAMTAGYIGAAGALGSGVVSAESNYSKSINKASGLGNAPLSEGPQYNPNYVAGQ